MMTCIECGAQAVSDTELCESCTMDKNRSEGMSLDMNRQHDMSINCASCQRIIFSDSKQCSSCRKSYHQTCDSSDGGTLNGFVCSACHRRSQMFSEDMMLSSSAASMRDHHAPLSPFSDPMVSQISLQMSAGPMTSSYPSHPDFGMDMYSQMSVSSMMQDQHHLHVQQMMVQAQLMDEISDGGATNDSDRNSSPFYQEASDYDEDFVPTSSRGRGRGSGGKKKPGRGQSTGSRRQTNPGPTGFFSATQMRTMGDFPQPPPTRGKRGKRGNGAATPRQAGKGPGRGRGRGRGNATQIAAALQQQVQYGASAQMINPMFTPGNPQMLQMNQMGIQMMTSSTVTSVLLPNTSQNVPSVPLPSNVGNQSQPSTPFPHPSAPPPPASLPIPEPPSTNVPNFQEPATDSIREVDEAMLDENAEQPVEEEEEEEKEEDDEYTRHAVVCRINDEFLQKACMCLNCGSIGRGAEGSMIACSNCSQTYHTYCVQLHEKFGANVMNHGWRCLDCTYCEVCGKGGDEKNLMLCEECDVSYHIYCLKTPLDKVPTGSWRCHWCARCRRCNHKIATGAELSRQGFCKPCDSLQQCPTCNQKYKLNQKIIRCSQCNKWEHGHCEGLFTDEQLEQAAINRMRCAACRPTRLQIQGLSEGDMLWCDFVALNRDAHEVLKSKYTPSALRNHILETGYRESFDHYDEESAPPEENADPSNPLPVTGQRGRGRGNPSGRRGMNRIGVGGFYVKLPRHRIQALNEEAAAAAAEEDDPKKPKRPRKPRRSQLEDAYPAQIQEAFFGTKAVEGKTLVDTTVEDPEMEEEDSMVDEQKEKVSILCRSATDMLHNDKMENECLNNLDFNMENMDDMDFSLLLGGDDENNAVLEDSLQGDTDIKEELPEGSYGPTSFNIDQKPPTSIGGQLGPPEGMQPGMSSASFAQQAPGVRAAMSRSGSQTDASDRYQFSARWEEDEPNGDKATTAAVLYSNEKHPQLKTSHPVWSERVKQIQKLWRNLNPDERLEYVNRARDNRTKGGSKPRPRRANVHSTNSVDSPTIQSPAPQQFGFKVPVNPVGPPSFPMFPPAPPLSSTPTSSMTTAISFSAPENASEVKQIAVTYHLEEDDFHRYQHLKRVKLDREKLIASLEEQLNKARKQKKNLAAKRRQMQKTRSAAPDYDGTQAELNDNDQQILTQLADQIKATQSEIENSKKELKNDDSGLQIFESGRNILRDENTVTQEMIESSKNREDNYAIQLEQKLAQQSQAKMQSQGLGQIPGQVPLGSSSSLMHQQQQLQHHQNQQRMMQQGMQMIRSGPPGQFMIRQPTGQQMTMQQHQQEMHRRMMQQQMRQPRTLGGIRYDMITDPVMKDVYECLEAIVFDVHSIIEGHREAQHQLHGPPPPHFVQRMMQHPGAPGPPGPRLIMPGHLPPGQMQQLNPGKPLSLPPPQNLPQSVQPQPQPMTPLQQQPPPLQQQLSSQISEDGPKPKKKRTQQKKTVTSFPAGSDYDAWVEAMRARFRLCPHLPKTQREPGLDTEGAMYVNHGLAKLDVRRAPKKPLRGQFGSLMVRNGVRLFGNADRKRKAVTSNDVNLYQVEPPIRLVALYNNSMPVTEDEVFQDDMDEDNCLNPSEVILNLVNKRHVSQDHIRSRARYIVDEHPPVAPENTLFYEDEEEEEDVTVELVFNTSDLTQDSSVEDKKDLCSKLHEQIRDLLSIKGELPWKMEDTPPDSPASISPEPEPSEGIRQTTSTSRAPSVSMEKEIKKEEEDDMPAGPIFRVIKEEAVDPPHPQNCKHCQRLFDEGVSSELRYKMERLGVLPLEASIEEKDEIVAFCSRKCYYEFMSSSRIPLTDDELIAAEQCVSEETYNKLKQIVSDSIVKAINQGKKPPGPSTSSSSLLANADLVSPRDTRYMMDEGRKEFMTLIPVSSLIGNLDGKSEEAIPRSAAGIDWRVYTQDIEDSFARIKQQYDHFIMSPKLGVPLPPYELDKRICVFCGGVGDGESDKCGRLISFTEYYWVHVNCALWSAEVFENVKNGSLINVDKAVFRAAQTACDECHQPGASVKCHKANCGANYHVICAMKNNGYFIKDRTFICKLHERVAPHVLITDFRALRKLYVKREEDQLLARLFDLTDGSSLCLRLGAFTFHKLGSITPKQIKRFHSKSYIFPNNYRITRMFWSPRNFRDRMTYECSIEEHNGNPLFIVKSLDDPTICIRATSATKAWTPIYDRIVRLRDKEHSDLLKFFGAQIPGETLFGLNEAAVIKITESLPGFDGIHTYEFRDKRSPVLELPLAKNLMGCARAEPRSRTIGLTFRTKPQPMGGICHSHGITRPSEEEASQIYAANSSLNDTLQTRQAATAVTSANSGRTRGVRSFYTEEAAARARAFGISPDLASLSLRMETTNNGQSGFSAYQKMRKEWKDRVYLARSRIAGLGLYAKVDISMGEYIIEYKGEIIRSEVCEVREIRYTIQNRGVYMFRIDDEWVIDATMAGGPARYINHSCDPNCSTQILNAGAGSCDKKIIITANRPISKNEELTYDYQFELEGATDKIPCLCGAPNCGKWMN